MARKVVDPAGVRWSVGRVFTPWRPRLRSQRPDWMPDGSSGWSVDDAGGVFVAFGLLVALALVVLVIFPVVVLGAELLVVAFALIATVGARVVLRKPWTVRAEATDGREHERRVKGFRASGERRDRMAEALERGDPLQAPAEP